MPRREINSISPASVNSIEIPNFANSLRADLAISLFTIISVSRLIEKGRRGSTAQILRNCYLPPGCALAEGLISSRAFVRATASARSIAECFVLIVMSGSSDHGYAGYLRGLNVGMGLTSGIRRGTTARPAE
jgi:hypothetical protein